MTTGYVGPTGQWISTADTPNQGTSIPAAGYKARVGIYASFGGTGTVNFLYQ